jgi:hypothetical protein
MNGKTGFAIDYLNALVEMSVAGKARGAGLNPISTAVISLLLYDWGLNPKEVFEATRLYFSAASYEDSTAINKRIVTAFENRAEDKKRFMHNLATIAALDEDFAEKERSVYQRWGNMLDFKPTELETMWIFGWNLALMLRFVGSSFHEQLKNLPQT